MTALVLSFGDITPTQRTRNRKSQKPGAGEQQQQKHTFFEEASTKTKLNPRRSISKTKISTQPTF
jgi:hypothetical protein